MSSPYLKLPRSEIRTNILLSLLKKDRTMRELKAQLGSRDTTILHALKDLQALDLTIKSGKIHRLTTLGILEAMTLDGFCSITDVLEKFKDFWLLHDITAIPSQFLRRIGDLQDAKLIKSNRLKLTKVHERFLEILINAKRLRGISPIFHPHFVEAINQVLGKGALVELILSRQVFKKTIEETEREILGKYLVEEKLKIFLNNNLRLALTITDQAFSLGLFNLGGNYDYTMDLMSSSQEAIQWGIDLFQHILKESRIVKLQDLNP